MATATIDLDTLNNLFDNQKKLDDVFSSIFDEDSYLGNSMSFEDQALGSSDQRSSQDLHPNDDLSLNAEDKTFVHNKRSIANFVMPVVLEIAAIYYCIIYFI